MGQNPPTSAVVVDSPEAKNELTSSGLEGVEKRLVKSPQSCHSLIP